MLLFQMMMVDDLTVSPLILHHHIEAEMQDRGREKKGKIVEKADRIRSTTATQVYS